MRQSGAEEMSDVKWSSGEERSRTRIPLLVDLNDKAKGSTRLGWSGGPNCGGPNCVGPDWEAFLTSGFCFA